MLLSDVLTGDTQAGKHVPGDVNAEINGAGLNSAGLTPTTAGKPLSSASASKG